MLQLVLKDNDAARIGCGFGQDQILAMVKVLKNSHPAPDDGGVYEEMELIDQVVPDEGGYEGRAAVGDDIAAGLCF
jgi:hypothetical protein